MSVSRTAGFAAFALALFFAGALAAQSQAAVGKSASVLDAPVKKIADQRLAVNTPQGNGTLPVYADHQLNVAAPEVKRVLIVVHGTLRNADVYFADGRRAVEEAGATGAGSLVVAPQFLIPADIEAFGLESDTLAWTQDGWKGGELAVSPAPISSFSAMDALLEHFTDRTLYPALTDVVVSGHSAGAQIVQRYAVAGRAQGAMVKAGIKVHYVVANPSTYLYFDNRRPDADGNFQAAVTTYCPRVNRWKYGMEQLPAYVSQQDLGGIEARFAERKVTYLLGMADTNPYTHFIDRSCPAMAQGPNRLARGLAYFKYLRGRHPAGLNQSVVEVPEVGHDGRGMYGSACGQAVLFGQALPASCPHIP
ncbi:MAG: alpha/beta hydrolase [Collimonas sp.]|uniref:alpha/beta hydrolase n=1 Tax=Collimonas sp. TaxID=1963772 RepID=UPI00326641C0